MREYLDPTDNYKFHKIHIGDAPHWMVEIPDGADVLLRLNSGLSTFYKDNFKKVWDLGIWCSTSNAENLKEKVRLWERESMKEWLLKTEDGKYHFHRDDMDFCPKYIEKIEIPEGATHLLYSEINNKLKHFANNENKLMALYDIEDGCGHWYGDAAGYMYRGKADILWQRKDDSVVEAEVFKDDKKHSHYFKDVSHLDYVDVYRVLELFGVREHAIGHAIKKLLVAGMRGAKNQPQDIQEAIDTLVRYQEMRKEDKK